MPGELTSCDNKDPGEPTIPVISDISSSLEGSLDKLIIPFKSKISSPNEPPISFKKRVKLFDHSKIQKVLHLLYLQVQSLITYF